MSATTTGRVRRPDDGHETLFVETGAGDVHLTLVHGVGASHESWEPVIEALGPSYRTLRYDLRGHGESGKPPGPYSLDDYVEDIEHLLGERGVARTTIVGFSFGGTIGPGYVLAHPERVERLVVVSGICGRSEEERARIDARASALEAGGATTTIDAAIERWFTPAFREAHPELIEARKQRALENDPAGYAAAYRVFADADLVDEVHRITCPTLVMTGEDDPGSHPGMARNFHQRIAGSRLRILGRLRHSVLVEAPDLIARHIDRFVQSTLADATG